MIQESENRPKFMTLEGGLIIFKVKLIGGAYDGTMALASGNTVSMGGELYMRGKDDFYYHHSIHTN